MFYIIGNGGFAKEVLFLAQEVKGSLKEFGGFIDFKPAGNTIRCMGAEFKVLDEDDFLNQDSANASIELFIGIGDPIKIEKIAVKFEGFHFPNLIHPSYIGHSSVRFDRGNIVTAGCIFTVDIQVGAFNIFNLNSTFGHDAVIGNSNVFNPGVNISGGVRIGSRNLIGTNATMLQNVTMGDDSVLGAGSLANKCIGNREVHVGVPAKPLQR